jgi:hypothetical protein
VSAPRSSAEVDGGRGHGRRGIWRRRGALRVSALELRAAAGTGTVAGTVAAAGLGPWAAAEFGIAAAVAAAWSLGGGRRTRVGSGHRRSWAAARSLVVSVVAASAGRRERGRWGSTALFSKASWLR